jgi:hypothetical protein
MFCGVFIAEEVDGVGDKGLGDTTTVVHTLLEDFVHMSLIFACFIMNLFTVKSRTSILGPTLFKARDF